MRLAVGHVHIGCKRLQIAGRQLFGRHAHGLVASDDVVEVDMPPAAGAAIDDPDRRLATLPICNVPVHWGEAFATAWRRIGSRRRSDYLVVDDQIDSRLFGVPSAAD